MSGLKSNCISCGLPLSTPQDQLKYCQICSEHPSIEAVIGAHALKLSQEKETKLNEQIISMAIEYVSELPHWQNSVIPEPDDLYKGIYKNAFSLELEKEMENLDLGPMTEISGKITDIFISHTWKGPDKDITEPLVNKLKSHGYSIWLDKEKFGERPGKVNDICGEAMSRCRQVVVILCKPYFDSDYCIYEFEEMFRLKNEGKIEIIPIWWKDYNEITPEFLKQKVPSCYEAFRATRGVLWDEYQGDVNILFQLVAKISEDLEGTELHDGIELQASEVRVLKELEQLIHKSIPQLRQKSLSLIKDPKELPFVRIGFLAENTHVIALSLRQSGIERMKVTIPSSFFRLDHLKVLIANLVDLPENFGNLTSLELLLLYEGWIKEIPESISKLTALEKVNLNKNPIQKVGEKGLKFLKKWHPPKHYNLSPEESDFIFLLEFLINSAITKQKPPSTKQIIIQDGHIVGLELKTWSDLNTLPENIDNLKYLQYVKAWNKFSYFPKSIGNVKSLREINIPLNQVSYLPDSICNSKSLEILKLGLNPLKALPRNIGDIESLRWLDVTRTHLKFLPETIGNLQSLETLYIWQNKLEFLPESMSNLASLKELYIGIEQLELLPEGVSDLSSLKTLYVGMDSVPEGVPKPKSFGLSLNYIQLNDKFYDSLPSKSNRILQNLMKNGCEIKGVLLKSGDRVKITLKED